MENSKQSYNKNSLWIKSSSRNFNILKIIFSYYIRFLFNLIKFLNYFDFFFVNNNSFIKEITNI